MPAPQSPQKAPALLPESAARESPGIEWLGQVEREQVTSLMQRAWLLIFPSVCYETFGLAIIEAFATGLPVVASNLGVMSSLVKHRHTGLHFCAGNADDLVAQIRWAQSHPADMAEMRRAARQEYEVYYTAERNYEMLINIYQTAIRRARPA